MLATWDGCDISGLDRLLALVRIQASLRAACDEAYAEGFNYFILKSFITQGLGEKTDRTFRHCQRSSVRILSLLTHLLCSVAGTSFCFPGPIVAA